MKNIFDFVCLLLLGVLFFFFDWLFLNTLVFLFSSWRFCCVQYVSVSACIRCFCIVFCFFCYTRQSTWLFFLSFVLLRWLWWVFWWNVKWLQKWSDFEKISPKSFFVYIFFCIFAEELTKSVLDMQTKEQSI